jgi:peptidoglycan hydrolase-like protein with peptidoglycan-binding domain
VTQLGSPPAAGGSPESGAKESGSHRPGQAAAGTSRLARRRRVLLEIGIVAALLAVGGVIGASFVKSPQQLAADTAPPAPTQTTATVVSRVLTASVQMRGVVYPATEYDVYPTAPTSSSSSSSSATSASGGASNDSSAGSGSALYISKLNVAAGSSIRNGKRLAEIDGHPLFALAGKVPAWRDLTPGESGPDVRELQQALGKLGYYDNGDLAGYYGSATEYAVALYFEHFGYTPPADGSMPAADVVFLPSLPATVVAVNGASGEQPGQPFLQLAARGSLALTGELPPAYAGQVKAGLKVTLYDELTGIRASGTVSELGTATTLTPAGAIVNIGSPPATSDSSSAATASGASGSSSASSGSTEFIPVTVHPSKPLKAALNNENVLVTPAKNGKLAAGDHVVVSG